MIRTGHRFTELMTAWRSVGINFLHCLLFFPFSFSHSALAQCLPKTRRYTMLWEYVRALKIAVLKGVVGAGSKEKGRRALWEAVPVRGRETKE